MEDDKCDKSHIADHQNCIDLNSSVTVRMAFVNTNLDFKLYVSDNYVIIIIFPQLENLATLNNLYGPIIIIIIIIIINYMNMC